MPRYQGLFQHSAGRRVTREGDAAFDHLAWLAVRRAFIKDPPDQQTVLNDWRLVEVFRMPDHPLDRPIRVWPVPREWQEDR